MRAPARAARSWLIFPALSDIRATASGIEAQDFKTDSPYSSLSSGSSSVLERQREAQKAIILSKLALTLGSARSTTVGVPGILLAPGS